MFFGMTSGMLAQKPLAFVIELTGWRDAMYMLAGGGALLSVLVYILSGTALWLRLQHLLPK